MPTRPLVSIAACAWAMFASGAFASPLKCVFEYTDICRPQTGKCERVQYGKAFVPTFAVDMQHKRFVACWPPGFACSNSRSHVDDFDDGHLSRAFFVGANIYKLSAYVGALPGDWTDAKQDAFFRSVSRFRFHAVRLSGVGQQNGEVIAMDVGQCGP